jgi:hypothetical protein
MTHTAIDRQQHSQTQGHRRIHMSRSSDKRYGPRFKSRTEQVEYWVIFVPCFAAFFVSACVSRIASARPHVQPTAVEEPRQSVLKEAWSAADLTTSSAFMG